MWKKNQASIVYDEEWGNGHSPMDRQYTKCGHGVSHLPVEGAKMPFTIEMRESREKAEEDRSECWPAAVAWFGYG